MTESSLFAPQDAASAADPTDQQAVRSPDLLEELLDLAFNQDDNIDVVVGSWDLVADFETVQLTQLLLQASLKTSPRSVTGVFPTSETSMSSSRRSQVTLMPPSSYLAIHRSLKNLHVCGVVRTVEPHRESSAESALNDSAQELPLLSTPDVAQTGFENASSSSIDALPFQHSVELEHDILSSERHEPPTSMQTAFIWAPATHTGCPVRPNPEARRHLATRCA